MRIGCLQFSPQVGDVANNLNRAEDILSQADPADLDSIDLLVLPEMAFSGYNFKSVDHIRPYLEDSGSGITALWARTTALKHDCTVAVGYPEKADSQRNRPASAPNYYNSLLVVNGDGEILANYRKSFLYYTDATWAREGSGFYAGKIDGFGKVAMGICMDINPYRFEAPWDAFEFGFHILEVNANLVILSMAWLTLEDRSTFTPNPEDPDMETITYWVQRLEPVIRSNQEDEIIVVFCNRCGIEDDVVYAGSSAVLGIKDGQVSVYGLLGRGVKELLVVDTDDAPFAKLASRPDSTGAHVEHSEEPFEEDVPSAESSHDDTQVPHTGNETATVASAASEPELAAKDAEETLASAEPNAEPQTAEQDGVDISGNGDDQWCSGNCGGCEEHMPGGDFEVLETPICPSPTPLCVRPRLALSTGSDSLPPLSTQALPRGTQPGNFFTSRDLCTPPMTAFDENPMTAFDDEPMTALDEPPAGSFNNFSRPATRFRWDLPSAKMVTPEEPTWPVFETLTKAELRRPPSRNPSLRPASRAGVGSSSRSTSQAEPRVPFRPPSQAGIRNSSKPRNLAEPKAFPWPPIRAEEAPQRQRNQVEKEASEAKKPEGPRGTEEEASLAGEPDIALRSASPKPQAPSREISPERGRGRRRASSIARDHENRSAANSRPSIFSESEQFRGRDGLSRAHSASPGRYGVMDIAEKGYSRVRSRSVSILASPYTREDASFPVLAE